MALCRDIRSAELVSSLWQAKALQIDSLPIELQKGRDLLGEPHEEAKVIASKLHQVWEGLVNFFFRTGANEKLMASQAEALQQAEATGQEQAARLEALEAEVLQISRERDEAVHGRNQLSEARKETERTLSQLHQVQAELESYVLRLNTSEQLAASQAEALQQAEATGQEQATRLEALEAEVLQISRERDDAVLGRDQLIEALENQLSEAREEADLTLLLLHQVQEDLELYFFRRSTSEQLAESQAEILQQAEATCQEQAARLEALEAEVLQISRERDEAVHVRDQQSYFLSLSASEQLAASQAEALQQAEATGQEQAARLEALEEVLQISRERDEAVHGRNQLSDAREEAELTLLQLHQVQEELEHYFLRSLASDQLVQTQFEQLQRAQRLMLRLHPPVVPTAPIPPALAVQVLPEVAAAVPSQTLQTEALLNTYAASLQRASALLEWARRS
jgi:hypothetical protein